MLDAETAYMSLLDAGATPQEARSVLPNSLKTEIVMTANIREWRHFFYLRCAPDAHPQMRQIAWLIFDCARCEYPELFEDILPKVYEGDSEHERIMELRKEVDKGLKKGINSPSMAFKERDDAVAALIREVADLKTEICEQAKKEDNQE